MVHYILYCIIFHRSGSASGSTYHFVLYPLLVLIFFLFTSTAITLFIICCGAVVLVVVVANTIVLERQREQFLRRIQIEKGRYLQALAIPTLKFSFLNKHLIKTPCVNKSISFRDEIDICHAC